MVEVMEAEIVHVDARGVGADPPRNEKLSEFDK